MIKGLVMEGGSMRGMFTCGILDVFMENGITFDKAVGVSAGAAFGINLKSHQPGRALRYNKKFCRDKRYASLESLIKTGDLYNVNFCYDELPFKLDIWDTDAFYKDPMEFYCVATDVLTGRPVYHKCAGDAKADIDWVRASASLPLVSKPVEIDGGLYLDGGMSDSIPVKFMENEGADRIVVIATRPADYVKTQLSYLPLVKLIMRKYPKMIGAVENRYLIYNRQKEYMDNLEKEGKIFVFRPDKALDIGAVERDPYTLHKVYMLGRKQAVKRLEELKDYLGK